MPAGPRPPSPELARTRARLEELARSMPDAWEDHPWDERVFKVNKKIFLFLTAEVTDTEGLSMTVKLPDSHEEALAFAFTSPTGYGLGRAGWVTARFSARARPPIDILTDWVDESYRAIATRRQVAELDLRRAGEPRTRGR